MFLPGQIFRGNLEIHKHMVYLTIAIAQAMNFMGIRKCQQNSFEIVSKKLSNVIVNIAV